MKARTPKLRLNKGNSLVVTAPLAVVTIVYFAYVYVPMRTKISELRRERDGIELLVRESQRMSTQLETTREQLTATQAFIARQTRRLVPVETAMDDLASIPILARQANATIERFEPSPPSTTDKSLARIPVQVQCAGSFAELFAFLGELETLPNKLWIDELKFEAGREAGQKTKCEVKLVVFAERSANSD